MSTSPFAAVRSTAAAPARAVSRRLADAGELLDTLPRRSGTLAFVGSESALVGWGEFARFSVRGADAAGRIASWFAELCRSVPCASDPGLPGGGGLHAFVSLGFDDVDESVAIVPSTLLARRDGVTFGTFVGSGSSPEPRLVEPEPIRPPGPVRYADDTTSVADFQSGVGAATRRIRAGELDKVVLARGLEATSDEPLDERYLLRRLRAAYPSCWTYAVEGLLGASPEMLVRRSGRTVTSRVLAGTAWSEEPRRSGADIDAALMSSGKDRSEHVFAVASVADRLAAVLDELHVPERPHPLHLANLTHLATDITGLLPDSPDGGREAGPTALGLAALLHPTAAVGGTPAWQARQVIRELEPNPRGRYAAPVGWLDAQGDGEFAIALRGAQISGRSIRLMAGCGIVADSDPLVETREAAVKMVPIRDALEDF